MICAGILLAYLLSTWQPFHDFLVGLGDYGYLSALLAGFFFVSIFTVGTGIVMLLYLAENLNPIELALIAALGGVLGDLTILKFIKSNLDKDIERLFKDFDRKKHIRHLFNSKYFSWSLPVIGSLIMISPLPDELGISLLGISKIKTIKFVLLSFTFNFIGVLLAIFGIELFIVTK